MRRAPALAAVLLLACSEPPPPPPAPPVAAPAPAEPTATPEPTPEGLTAAQLMDLPEDAEYGVWGEEDAGDVVVEAPKRRRGRARWETDLPVDADGDVFWPMIPAGLGVDPVAFARDHHVQLRFADRPFGVPAGRPAWSGSPPTKQQMRAFIPALVEGLRMYPPDVLRAAHVDHVVLVHDVRFRGAERSSSAIAAAGVILIDLDHPWETHPGRVRTVHHEVFHMLDYAHDGDLWNDREWRALNPPDFAYGGGGKTMVTVAGAGKWADTPGFVTRYATSGDEEDKAEVYGWWVTERERMVRRLKTDAVLAAKVAHLEAETIELDPWFREVFPAGGGGGGGARGGGERTGDPRVSRGGPGPARPTRRRPRQPP